MLALKHIKKIDLSQNELEELMLEEMDWLESVAAEDNRLTRVSLGQ